MESVFEIQYQIDKKTGRYWVKGIDSIHSFDKDGFARRVFDVASLLVYDNDSLCLKPTKGLAPKTA